MKNTFVCPHCKENIEISEALTHQIEEDIKTDIEQKYAKELERSLVASEEKIRRKLEEANSLKEKDRENETKELRQMLTSLREELLETSKQNRQLKEKDEQRALDMEKQIATERERARNDALTKVMEEYRLKDLEKEKVINDLKKSLDEMKRKAEQGSMQTQGEVLELDIEALLKREFPDDDIEPVGKGISGADIKQTVKSPLGTDCGIILWELKRTKSWSDEWVVKLKNDLRTTKSHCAAIVSQALPEEAQKGIGNRNGIWVSSYQLIVPLAMLLRKNLLDVRRQKAIQDNSATNAEHLYNYITGHEFRQQLEAMVEVFLEMHHQITKEKIAFEKIWKTREAQTNRLLMSSSNIVGGLQGSGASIVHIKGLDLLELTEGTSDKNNSESEQTLLDLT